MRAKISVVFVVGLVLSAVGCQSATPQRREPVAILQRTSTLYLAPGPYESIYVEIDAVEGAELPQETIDELVAFIETHCRKPVTVVMSDIIAAEEAAGLDPAAVALRHIDGPPEGAESEPAFIHILLHRGWGKRRVGGAVAVPYPCGVLVNMAIADVGWFLRGARRQMISPGLRHEVGHILGLCAGGDDGDGQYHGDANHCYDSECLMRGKFAVSYTRALFGMDQRIASGLCDKCLAELEEKRALGADPGLSFHGPALVRQEDGYYVALLPKCSNLGFGEPEAAGRRDYVERARDVVEYIRSEMPEEAARALREPGRHLSHMTGDPSSPSVFAARRDAVERAAEDTDRTIRGLAKNILENGEIQTQPPWPFSGTDAAEWIILPETQQAEEAGDGD